MMVSRVRGATLGAGLTVLGLVGGVMGGLFGGSLIFHSLIEKAPDLLTYTLAVIGFFGCTVSGSALWGAGMARLAGIPAMRRAALVSGMSFAPLIFLLNLLLVFVEPVAVKGSLPVHRLFTVLFVPTAFLISATSCLALGRALGRGRSTIALALRVGLAVALGFLIVNLAMEALGWQIGAPGAEERGTMLMVLLVSNLGAALAGGAVLGMTLTQPRGSFSRHGSPYHSA